MNEIEKVKNKMLGVTDSLDQNPLKEIE